jgi:ABC-type multidrug transport system permease subunit
VVKVLKRLTRQGKTVVATLHQPSSEIFHMFDDILLLSRGRVIYYGTAQDAIGYFTARGFNFPEFTNPSDFIFMKILKEFDDEAGEEDVSAGEKSEARLTRLLGEWEESEERRAILAEMAAEPENEIIHIASLKTRTSFRRQFGYLLGRASKNAIRNKMIIRVRLAQSLFVGVLIGLVYLDAFSGPVLAQVQNVAGVLFFLTINQFFGSATSVLSIFAIEKVVFLREFSAGYYGLTAYYVSKVLVELPHQIFFPLLLLIIAYYMIGLNPAFSAYLMAGVFVVMSALCGTAVGTLVACLFDDISIALAVLPVILLPILLFSGLFVNSGTFPVWLGWLQYISPCQYAFTGLVENQFPASASNLFKNCDPSVEDCTGQGALDRLGLSGKLPLGVNVIFMVVIYVTLVLAAYLVLLATVSRTTLRRRRYLKRQLRSQKEV